MTQKNRPRTRLFVAADLIPGASLALDNHRSHYLRNVLRLKPGDELLLFNGRDGEYRGAVSFYDRARAYVTVAGFERAQTPRPDLWLLFAPIKRNGIDLIAEKATELGVGRLWPVVTRHTDVARVNAERLYNIAMEAAEQSERLEIPEIYEAMPLPKALADWPPERRLILCAEAGPVQPIAQALQSLANTPLALLTGPEGGFACQELEMLLALPFVVPVGLGPRILKADTAALAALACVQALAGDWTSDATEATIGPQSPLLDQRPPWRARS